jgi:hypothetical protein
VTSFAHKDEDARGIRTGLAAVCFGVWLLCGSLALAQGPAPYYPIDQNQPPGTAALWSTLLGRGPSYYQPVRVVLPTEGKITFYSGASRAPSTIDAPGTAGLLVGGTYRIRISDMPKFPGVTLYPSIEVLDRLHPPAGRKYDFPVILEITLEEIQLALQDRLVTKVVYLERPQTAVPRPLSKPAHVDQFVPSDNLLSEAQRLGRPMLIVRIGGRLPAENEKLEFYGSGVAVEYKP